MNHRHSARCDYCGRFMSWARWSSWNCFAGFARAWCDRPACESASLPAAAQ